MFNIIILNKSNCLVFNHIYLRKIGGQGGTRTRTVIKPLDFKSNAAAITPLAHIKPFYN